MLVESSKGRAPSRPVIASLIGVVVVIWAINFIAAKIGLRSFPPLTMASFRVCAAGVVMIPFYLVSGVCGWRHSPKPPQRGNRGFTWRDVVDISLLGIFRR